MVDDPFCSGTSLTFISYDFSIKNEKIAIIVGLYELPASKGHLEDSLDGSSECNALIYRFFKPASPKKIDGCLPNFASHQEPRFHKMGMDRSYSPQSQPDP